jgi:hypothetical protein
LTLPHQGVTSDLTSMAQQVSISSEIQRFTA